MLNKLSKDQIGFLLLVHRLLSREKSLDKDNLVSIGEIKLPRVSSSYEKIFSELQEIGLLEGNPDVFSLTPTGESLVEKAGEQYSLVGWFYDEYFSAVQKSKAHSVFCERVYGKDLSQHGIADMQQLSIMLEELDLKKGMNLLDFGCGDGKISEYLSDLTTTRVSGLDKARGAINLALERTAAKRDRLDFYWADIEKGQGELPQEKFDRVIAIDSIFFSPDLKKVFSILLNLLKSGGRMALFFICPSNFTAETTTLGKLLGELEIDYRVLDLSNLNKQHWILKKEVLLEIEGEFSKEGSEFLFKNRIAECNGLENAHRYLYIIDK